MAIRRVRTREGWFADVNFASALAHATADSFSSVMNIVVAIAVVLVDGEEAREQADGAGALLSAAFALVAALVVVLAYVRDRIGAARALSEATGHDAGESGGATGTGTGV